MLIPFEVLCSYTTCHLHGILGIHPAFFVSCVSRLFVYWFTCSLLLFYNLPLLFDICKSFYPHIYIYIYQETCLLMLCFVNKIAVLFLYLHSFFVFFATCTVAWRYWQYIFMALKNKISHSNTLIPFYFISINIPNLLFSCRYYFYLYRFILTFMTL
jgi:hypothetical protein